MRREGLCFVCNAKKDLFAQRGRAGSGGKNTRGTEGPLYRDFNGPVKENIRNTRNRNWGGEGGEKEKQVEKTEMVFRSRAGCASVAGVGDTEKKSAVGISGGGGEGKATGRFVWGLAMGEGNCHSEVRHA